MAPIILDWKNIDVEQDLRFSAAPKKGMQHDGFSVFMNVMDTESGQEVPFYHQAPMMALPFGISTKEQNGKIMYKANFSFSSVRYDPVSEKWTGEEEMLKYFEFIRGLDEYNKTHVHKNFKTWFKKEVKKEVLDEFYFNNLWTGDKVMNGEYAPTFSAKLKASANQVITKFFSNKQKPDGTYESIEFEENESGLWRGLKVIPLLRTSGLWFAGKTYGMSFQIEQMMIFFKNEFVGCAIDVDPCKHNISVTNSDSEETPELTNVHNKRPRLNEEVLESHADCFVSAT